MRMLNMYPSHLLLFAGIARMTLSVQTVVQMRRHAREVFNNNHAIGKILSVLTQQEQDVSFEREPELG